MDVKRLRYTQEIFIRQRMLEDELARLNSEKKENIKNCDHTIPIILNKGANPTPRCLLCGFKLGSYDVEKAVDASEYKEEDYGEGYQDSQKIGRINECRDLASLLLTENPKMTDDELREELKNEILNEKNKNKIKKMK